MPKIYCCPKDSSVLMAKPCVQMNEAFSSVVNYVKEAPMMTNAVSSKTNNSLNRNELL